VLLSSLTFSIACQKHHWPVHRKECKEGDKAPSYQVKVVDQLWPNSSKFAASIGTNKLDYPVDMSHKGMVHSYDKNAPLIPDSGVGNKAFMVKLQCNIINVGMPDDGGIAVHDPDKNIACSRSRVA
jgi:hypothetical protein